MKDIHSSVDSFRVHHSREGYDIHASGWAFRNKDKIHELSIFVDGKEINTNCKTIERSDVYWIFRNSAPDVNVGFSLDGWVATRPESIELRLTTEKSSFPLLQLDSARIEKFLNNEVIENNVDDFTLVDDNSVGVIAGWALDFTSDPLEFSVLTQDGTAVDSTVRLENRRDLVQMGVVDKGHSLCGFRLTFPFEAGNSYTLVIHSKQARVNLPLQTTGFKVSGKMMDYIRQFGPDRVVNAANYLQRNGMKKFIRRVIAGPGGRYDYDRWFKNQRVSEETLDEQRLVSFDYAPKISLIVAAFNTKEHYLREMIDSVLNQSYGNWELCIADGSDTAKVQDFIAENYAADERIKYRKLDANYGISGNMNAALEMATGEYLGLYDHDDFLELDALYECVKALQDVRHDVIYTDEDKFDDSKRLFADPNFKPDFNVDLFRSHNYITHFFLVKMDIVNQVGGMQAEYDGAQDYDFMFRVFEKTQDIYHLPKVMYHWRMHNLSTALNPESKKYCYEAGKNAVADHYSRIGIKAKVTTLPKPYYGCYETKYVVTGSPLVSVIIPNKDNQATLKTCIDSLYKTNTYENIEILVVENNSTKADTFRYYEELEREHQNLKVLHWDREFNYSEINNFAAKRAQGDYLLFLNNDTELLKFDSIENMLGICQRPEVGAVGAKLLYDDDTIQHAGVVIGFSGYAGHVNHGLDANAPGYMMRAQLNCDYSAVTAACMMVRKDVFNRAGGFDPQFVVACNDVDLCLKIRELGYLVVYDAFSIWHHYESKTRGYEDSQEKVDRFNKEVALFQKKWPQILQEGDPYYNANFKIEKGPFEYL